MEYFFDCRYRNESSYQDGASGGSNNELSTLLPALPPPPQPLLQAFLASRRDGALPVCTANEGGKCDSPQHRSRLTRSGRVSRRQSSNMRRDMEISRTINGGLGRRSAKNFNDTTDGTVHCFIDERGHWVTYTFDEKGLGK